MRLEEGGGGEYFIQPQLMYILCILLASVINRDYDKRSHKPRELGDVNSEAYCGKSAENRRFVVQGCVIVKMFFARRDENFFFFVILTYSLVR